MLWIWKCAEAYGLEMPLLTHPRPFASPLLFRSTHWNAVESNWNRMRARNNVRWSKTEAANVISYIWDVWSAMPLYAMLSELMSSIVCSGSFHAHFHICSFRYIPLPAMHSSFSFASFHLFLLASFSNECCEKLSRTHTHILIEQQNSFAPLIFLHLLATIARICFAYVISTHTHTHNKYC